MLVAGLIKPLGTTGSVIEAIEAGRVELILTRELGVELSRVLERPKFDRYGINAETVARILDLAQTLLPVGDVPVPSRDPNDAIVVAAAVAADADAIVTGDADILDDAALVAALRDRGIAVLTPADLLSLLG